MGLSLRIVMSFCLWSELGTIGSNSDWERRMLLQCKTHCQGCFTATSYGSILGLCFKQSLQIKGYMLGNLYYMQWVR